MVDVKVCAQEPATLLNHDNSSASARTSHEPDIAPPLFRLAKGGIASTPNILRGSHPLALFVLHHDPLASTGSFGTDSSGSTIPGIGMYSGRVVNRVGQAIINVAEEFKIRKRLRSISRVFTAREEDQRISFYGDVVELLTALDDLNELGGRPNRSIALSKSGYPQRIVREALSTLSNVVGMGPTYTKYEMSPDDRMLLILTIADSYWILANCDSALCALSWILDILTALKTTSKRTAPGQRVPSYEPANRRVLQAICDAMAASPASLVFQPIFSLLVSFFRAFPLAKHALRPVDKEMGFVNSFLTAVMNLTKDSDDASTLADAYDIISILCFEPSPSESRLSEGDRKSLKYARKDTIALCRQLYVNDENAKDVFDVEGPHAAKEVVCLIKRQLYRTSFFERGRKPYVQCGTLDLVSQLLEKKKRKALTHYNAADILWECLADIESVDWLYDIDARTSTVRKLSDILSALDQDRSVFDCIADAWLRKKTSLVGGSVCPVPALDLCCFSASVLSNANKLSGELYLRDSGVVPFLSNALCKPRSLTIHDQKSINHALITLLNFSWCPALLLASNVPDFLVRQISFKADTSSSMDILRDWAFVDLDLLRQLYQRGGDDMQTAIKMSYDACRHNQHTVSRMKLFRTIMKSVLSEGPPDATYSS